MTYTITSAQWANEEETAAVVMTEESAAVMATADRTPALWAQLSGVQVADYVVPNAVPLAVSPFQAKAALLNAGLLASVEAAIAQASPVAQLAWTDAVEFRRDSATVATMAQALGLSSSAVDDLFRYAAGVTG